MQISTATVTRSIAQVAITVAQSVPALALSRSEEMLALGITAEDFADRGQWLEESAREALDAEAARELPTLPNYRETVGADVDAYKRELGLLWQANRRAGMDEATRIEGARKYLQQPALTSWKQLTPQQMRHLRHAIESGALTSEWELASSAEPTVAQPLEALPALPMTHAERVAAFALIGVDFG